MLIVILKIKNNIARHEGGCAGGWVRVKVKGSLCRGVTEKVALKAEGG